MALVALSRSRNAPLDLHIEEGDTLYGRAMPQALLPWTDELISPRVRKISYTFILDTFVGLGCLMGQRLSNLRELELGWMSDDAIPPSGCIPREYLGQQDQKPNLARLICRCVMPSFSSPFFCISLTHLTFDCPQWDTYYSERDELMPTFSQFQDLVSSLKALQQLHLRNFFPLCWSEIKNSAPAHIQFHVALRQLNIFVQCGRILQSPGYTSFWNHFTVPPSTVLILRVDMRVFQHGPQCGVIDGPDEEVLAPLIQDARNGWPPRELELCARSIRASHVDSPRSAWTQRQRYGKSFAQEDLAPSEAAGWDLVDMNDEIGRYLYSHKGFMPIIGKIPLRSLHTISIAPDMMEQLNSVQAWIDSFIHARAVRLLVVPLLHILPLLQTLVRDEDGEFSLFPALEVIVILEGCELENMEGRRALALKTAFLHAVRTRKRAQKPILEMRINGELRGMDVWEDLAKETDVAFF